LFVPPGTWPGWPDRWQDSKSHGGSSSHSSAESSSDSQAETWGSGQSVVPWYEYHEFHELSSRTWYTSEELTQQAIAWLMSDEERRAQFKLGSRKALPLRTATVEPVAVLPEEQAEFRAQVMPPAARPFSEVEAEIRSRVQKFLAAAEERRAIEEQKAQAESLGVPEDRREAVKPYRRRGGAR
jgi:hypothetical protein